MDAIGWTNGRSSFGVRISGEDRDRFFVRGASQFLIRIDDEMIAWKPTASFWGNCVEIRHASIKRYLFRNQLAPWPVGTPPVLDLRQFGTNAFALTPKHSRFPLCESCGSEIKLGVNFCHRCGTRASKVEQSANLPIKNDKELVLALKRNMPEPGHCQECGRKEHLSYFDFGLAKFAAKREWSDTAISAALSALTVPLFGMGMIRLPGKSERYSVMRLSLVLCEVCLSAGATYTSHPWYKVLWSYGYIEFIHPDQLAQLGG